MRPGLADLVIGREHAEQPGPPQGHRLLGGEVAADRPVRAPLARLGDVGAFPGTHRVGARRLTAKEEVVSRTALEDVDAAASVEHVSPPSPGDQVGSWSALECVGAVQAFDPIGSLSALNLVVARAGA